MVKEQELVLGNMSKRMLPNYTKRKFTSIDYEQMVMEVQQDVDEGMRDWEI